MDRKSEAFGLIAAAVAMAVAIATIASIGIGRLSPGVFVGALVISAPAVLAGRLVGLTLGIPRRPGFIFAFEIVTGTTALSLLDLSLALLFRLSALQSLTASAVIVAGLFAWKGRLTGSKALGGGELCWTDLAILPITACLVSVWDRATITSLRDAEKSGVFLGWPDLMIHATQINYLRG